MGGWTQPEIIPSKFEVLLQPVCNINLQYFFFISLYYSPEFIHSAYHSYLILFPQALNMLSINTYNINSQIFRTQKPLHNNLSSCKHPSDDQRMTHRESGGVTRARYCSGTRSGGGLSVTSRHLPAWEPVISLIMWLS